MDDYGRFLYILSYNKISMISKPSSLSSSIAFLFLGLTEAARFVYSIIKLKAIVVQWSEHRLVTSEVAGSSPVSRELPLSYHAVAATQQLYRTSTLHKSGRGFLPSIPPRRVVRRASCIILVEPMEIPPLSHTSTIDTVNQANTNPRD